MKRPGKEKLRGIFTAPLIAAAALSLLCACGAGSESATDRTEQNNAAAAAAEESAETVRDPGELVTRELFAMDTYMSVSAYGEDAVAALDEAEAEIMRLDALLAAEQDGSEIARINRNGGGRVSEDTAYLISRAMQIHEETGGAFEISVYPLKELWGFTEQEYRVPSEEEIQKTLQVVGTDLIELRSGSSEDAGTEEVVFRKDGVRIDLGGIAKGYASSRVAEIFEDRGVKGMINLGGNVQVVGTKADGSDWRVAIRKPEAEEKGAASWIDETSEQAAAVAAEDFLGIVGTSDRAIITSGGYERYFEKDGQIYHHIIDGRTGYPSDSDLISATVVSGDGTLADGLSTSIFVMGLERASDYWRSHSDSFDMIVMDRQGELFATEGLRDSFSSGLEIHWITK